MGIKEFITQYNELISTICAMVKLCDVIKNSSKRDKNIEKAFNTFISYWSSVDSRQQFIFKQKEELFHQSIKPRYDIERSYSKGYLSSGDDRIEFTLINKGLGNACNTAVECMKIMGVKPDDNVVFTWLEPANKNIIGVGECINFSFSCRSKMFPECVNVIIPVTFEDLAGRKYRQKFDLFVHKNGQIKTKNFPNVEMV